MLVPPRQRPFAVAILGIAVGLAAPAVAQEVAPAAEAEEVAPAAEAPAEPEVPIEELLKQLTPMPEPSALGDLDPPIQEQYAELRAEVDGAMSGPESERKKLGRAYGRLGMWAHVYRMSSTALIAYRNARILSPTDRRWPYYMAHVNRRLGNLDAAREDYARAHELRAGDVPTIVWLAEIEFESGRMDEALEWARSALALDPHCAHAMLIEGRVALARGQHEEAIIHFRDGLNERPKSSRIRYSMGLAFRGAGDMKRAEQALGRSSASDRRDEQRLMRDPLMTRLEDMNIGAKRYLRQGRTASRSGQLDRAIAFYVQAVEADPERVTLRDNLGSALLDAGRFDEALEQYEWIVERAPEKGFSWFGLAVAYDRAGRVDDAIAALRRSIEVDDDSAPAHFKLGTLLAARGGEAEALESYGRAIELESTRSLFRLERATLLMQLGRYAEASAALDGDLEKIPDGPGLHLMRARLWASSPQSEERDGERSLEIARKLAGRHTLMSAETIAMAHAELGDFESAIAWQKVALEAAAENDPTQPMDWVARRLALYEEGQPCREPWVAGERQAIRVSVSPPKT